MWRPVLSIQLATLLLLSPFVLQGDSLESFHPAAIVSTDRYAGTACFVEGQWWTNAHLVEGAPEAILRWRKGSWTSAATVAYKNVENDIMRLDVPDAPPMRWLEKSDREIKSGDPVMLYGYHTEIEEEIVLYGRFIGTYKGDNTPLVDIWMWPGLSGSCVVDATNGKFIGIARGTRVRANKPEAWRAPAALVLIP